MTLQQEKALLEIIRFAKGGYLVLGTFGLIIGALTNRSPWWCLPMAFAALVVAAEWWQERRVRALEKKEV